MSLIVNTTIGALSAYGLTFTFSDEVGSYPMMGNYVLREKGEALKPGIYLHADRTYKLSHFDDPLVWGNRLSKDEVDAWLETEPNFDLIINQDYIGAVPYDLVAKITIVA